MGTITKRLQNRFQTNSWEKLAGFREHLVWDGSSLCDTRVNILGCLNAGRLGPENEAEADENSSLWRPKGP